MKRRTIVVEGPLAFRMRRIVAARRAEAGIQIMILPQLAARLAGGFVRPARSQDFDPAIRTALERVFTPPASIHDAGPRRFALRHG